MWAAVRDESSGRVNVQVCSENDRIAGSDPAALKMLMDGEIAFFTLMGGLLAPTIPLADFQSMPFAFRDAAHALATCDGPLGSLLKREMEAKGLYGFKLMTFDNGVRQIGSRMRAIAGIEDLKGLKIRVPDGDAFIETFRALGAEPVPINVNGILRALENGRVDAQENALAVMEVFRLDRAQRYIAMTNHMWSGFNLMAHLPTWRQMPADIQTVIEREAERAIRAQRAEQAAFNAAVQARFESRGLIFTEVDQEPFRAALAPVYARYKEKLGATAWVMLEEAVCPLG